MIQFNLLPDVKLEYIKAKNMKRTVLVISALVAAVALAVFILMFMTVNVFQKGHLDRVNNDIKTKSAELKETPDLNKVLTVQNQLESLNSLHSEKPVTSRMFGYIGKLVPANFNIGELEVDMEASTMLIKGTIDATKGGDAANGLGNTNKFIDTLKFATYTYPNEQGETQTGQPFSGVVLADFTRTDKEATYEIKLNFDKAIFESSKNITLVVPKITSSRSETEKPTDLFKALPTPKEEQ